MTALPSGIDEGMEPPHRRTYLEITGLRLVSRANSRRHWRTVHADDKRTRAAVHALLSSSLSPWEHVVPREIIIDRHGPRLLDDDNLAGSGKAVRDAIARFFGVDDGPRGPMRWRYEQTQGKYGVAITLIYRHAEDACED